MEAFGKYVKRGDSVLDIGAGVGLSTELLLDLTPKICAADIALESLKLNPAPHKIAANAERLPFKGKIFDWGFSNFALHWCDWQKALKELSRVSRRGFFISIPVEGSLEGIGFPFPKEGDIIEYLDPSEAFVEEIEIPFRGRKFLLFFKKTGTGFNPNKTLSAFEILKHPQRVRFYGFRVLFVGKMF